MNDATNSLLTYQKRSIRALLRAPDGTFTTYGAPGSIETEASNINPAGAITGNYADASFGFHGFLRAP